MRDYYANNHFINPSLGMTGVKRRGGDHRKFYKLSINFLAYQLSQKGLISMAI